MVNKVFIAGGTGFVGSYIVKSLIKKGFDVTLLVKESGKKYLNSHANIVFGDILKPEKWIKSVSQYDVFINLVGIIREYPQEGITYDKIHIAATKNIVNLCNQYGIKRIIHMSAAGASPTGIGNYYITKYKAEEIIRSSGLDYTIFRPTMIFGDKDKTINKFASIIENFGIFPIFGEGGYKLQPIYVGDVAESLVKCINNPLCINKTFCLGGTEDLEYTLLIKQIALAMGKKVYLPLIPLKIIRAITYVMDRFRFYPITVEQLDMLTTGNVCKESDIFSLLGIRRRSLGNYLEETFGTIAKSK